MLDTSNKENVPPSYSYSVKECSQADAIDPSLAREKLVRMRIEEKRNEEVLRERGVMLDLEMKEILNRGEMQKELELEVDRLYRLKEIKLACMVIIKPFVDVCFLFGFLTRFFWVLQRVSRLRSLRDKEEEKKIKQNQLNKASTQHSSIIS